MEPAPPTDDADPDINPFTGEDLNPERLARRRRRGRIQSAAVVGVAVLVALAFAVLVWRDNRAPHLAEFTPPDRVGTLTRRDDAAARTAVSSLQDGPIQQLGPAHAAIYADSASPAGQVVVFQSARPASAQDLDALKNQIGRGPAFGAWRWVAAGKTGGQVTCAQVTGAAIDVVCIWADDAGSGLATFAKRPLGESVALLNRIREAGAS